MFWMSGFETVPMLIPMHGIGGRQDLPLPFEYVLAGAAVAVVASFVILGLAWPSARYTGRPAARPLPLAVSRFMDSPALRWTVRGIGLGVAGFMTVALLFGKDLLINPIFGFLYVWVWVGLVPISLLLGPVWRTLNPLRSLHLLGCALLRHDPDRGILRIRSGVGVWPAAAGLFGFVWLELVAPDRVTRPVVVLWLALYTVILLFGSVLFGQRWFTAADPFENYALLMAKLSPWCRDPATHRVAWRRPLTNLASTVPRPGLVVFVAVLLGSTAYDGFSNSTRWVRWIQDSPIPSVLLASATLTAFAAVVAVSYSAATVFSGRLTGQSRQQLPGLFVHSLLPIAVGYITAHYFTLFVLEGQRTLLYVSDPLSRGWNLFGTAELDLNTAIVFVPGLIAVIQAGAVVIGHIVGVIAAHDRALALFPRRTALIGQLPLLTVMVGYTLAGLLLLFSV